MSRAVVIGGSGHVGTYLVPRLVEAGYEVVNVSRGQRSAYQPHAAWKSVETIAIDRDAEDAAGTFAGKIVDLEPDIVIDKICFTLDSARQLVTALRGKVDHFLHTGTIWVHGPSVTVPTRESDARAPFGDYGTQKSEIEDYLLREARRSGFPATVVRPGHIVGPGWAPLNPAGHFNTEVFAAMSRGQTLRLPNFGLETVHHVHADDVAQMFTTALANPSSAIGEAFNAVSPAAITLRGYAEAMFAWFGHPSRLEFLPYQEWARAENEDDATATWEHTARSPCHSIAKAERHLGYAPRYSSLAAVQESVRWLRDNGQL
ncbi:MAG: NAD-dependent epimerase/dehydratase family protein [Hyphomicrobiales bacterium]|nr:NAD-dependent epimerase/dehydratase family protein [Hyphomicrobiales bacterium]